jgi:pSer/pThr/pTyr-binding forkhead associated (FHA) protein
MEKHQSISNQTGYTEDADNLHIIIQGVQYTIPLKEILYFESNLRKVIIHTVSQNYEYYERLDTLEHLLNTKGFIRCHQSYLASTANISSYSDTNLTIAGRTLPISRSRLEYIRHILQDINVEYQQNFSVETKARNNTTLSPVTTLSSGNTQLSQDETKENASQGVITCIEGTYQGSTLWLQPDKPIIIGRTIHSADVVINLPMVSRVHCEITYHRDSNTYEIIDYSANGTYINREFRLVPKIPYMLNPGTVISFGDQTTLYKLG